MASLNCFTNIYFASIPRLPITLEVLLCTSFHFGMRCSLEFFDLEDFLKYCGTANNPPKIRSAPDQAYLPKFEEACYRIAR